MHLTFFITIASECLIRGANNHTMKRFIIISTLILLSLPSIQAVDTASQVSKLGISGWYSQCNLTTPDLSESCIGDYMPNDEPLALDPTGNTCYVYPLMDLTTTAVGVHWLGPSPIDPNGVYLYSIMLLGTDVEMYKPTNCASSGACSCDIIEPFRGNWRNETCGGIGPSCSMVPVNDLKSLVGRKCAAFYRETTMYDGLVGSCFLLGTLVDLTVAPTTSPSPTVMSLPKSCAGDETRGASLLSLAMATISMLVAVLWLV